MSFIVQVPKKNLRLNPSSTRNFK